jgi:hypothetical protein
MAPLFCAFAPLREILSLQKKISRKGAKAQNLPRNLSLPASNLSGAGGVLVSDLAGRGGLF